MRVLLVSAHPDDIEINCGGTIYRLWKRGDEIQSIYMCPCSEDPKNTGHLEDHAVVVKNLGIDKLIGYNFQRRYLEYHKQDVRDILWSIKKQYKPELVICPSPHDFHQDHQALSECCMTIFRDSCSILGFESLRSSTDEFRANIFVILDAEDVIKKEEALRGYKILLKTRQYFYKPELYLDRSRMRGSQVLVDYAEAYELMRGRI